MCYISIPYRASSSPIWKCRVLASDAFLPTLSPSNISDILCSLPHELSLKDQNKSHGVLLLLSSILKHSNPTGTRGETVFTLANDTLTSLFTALLNAIYFGLKYVFTHISMYNIYMYMYMHMYVHLYTYICTCIYIYLCVY